jgi:sarcosine oxidase subunit gamma
LILKEGAFVTDLLPMTALGAAVAREATSGALTLRENDGLALASLALRRGASCPAPMGLQLPDAGGWSTTQGLSAFWTGPSQWMIEAEDRAQDDLAAELSAICEGCSISDQTDGFVCFEITSSAGAAPIVRLLEKLVNVDLAQFGAGRATRTAFEHMAIFVIRRADDKLAVMGMRSAAGSLWHAVEAAAARI